MTRLPILSGKQIIKTLQKAGYTAVRQRGSHVRLVCPGKKSVTVPDYRSVDRSLLKKILRDAEMDVEEFLSLLS